MLCPDELAALFAASRVVTRSLSSLYDERLFLIVVGLPIANNMENNKDV